MNDLTEKLKYLLTSCESPPSPWLATAIANQLAPEIEKMLPRWVPVSERLPEEGELVDIYISGNGGRWTGVRTQHSEATGYYFNWCHGVKCFWVKDNPSMHWMTIPKGPKE